MMGNELASPANHQFFVFATALILGIGLGLIIDIYRVIRSFTRGRRKWLIGVDFLFWLIVTWLSLYLIISFCGGEVYFYTYIGLAGGYSLYYGLFSRLVTRTERAIIVSLCKPLRKIYDLLIKRKKESNKSM